MVVDKTSSDRCSEERWIENGDIVGGEFTGCALPEPRESEVAGLSIVWCITLFTHNRKVPWALKFCKKVDETYFLHDSWLLRIADGDTLQYAINKRKDG